MTIPTSTPVRHQDYGRRARCRMISEVELHYLLTGTLSPAKLRRRRLLGLLVAAAIVITIDVLFTVI